jgi:hypothetical protein
MTDKRELPPDPERMNDARAYWAGVALRAFRGETNCEADEAPGDLLADLMHWCDRNGMDFETLLDGARRNYREETGQA